jgi:hypothetical protein
VKLHRLGLVSLVTSFLLAACGGKGANTAASDDPNDCGVVATRIVAFMGKQSELNTPETKTKVHNALAGTCTTGDWSLEVRACFVKATDEAGVATCGDQLTAEQKKDMIESLGLGTGTGGGGEPMTEPPPAS